MGSPLVSIIIRCYNEREYIGKLLHGISEQSIDDIEIILVDSGSTDGTLAVAKEFGVDLIEYISPENFSFGRSLNYGCNVASGDFCVIASAHVYPTRNDWLESLLAPFQNDPNDELALVYGKQRGNEVTSYSEKQIFKQWFPEEDIHHQPHPFCNNANAAIRRELWTKYPYNEELTGLEDIDWAKRVQDAGYEITYAADAEVIHVHDESAREVFNRYRREAYAHKQILPDQSFSLLDFIRLSTYHILQDYQTAVSQGELLNNVISIPWFRLLQFWGTYRGFKRDAPVSEQLWQRFYYPDRDSLPPTTHHESTMNQTNDRDEANRIDYSTRPDGTGRISMGSDSR